MTHTISTQHLTLSPEGHAQIAKKLEILDKHLTAPYETSVRLTHDTHHTTGEVVHCIIKIVMGKKVFHVEKTGGNTLGAVDEAVSAMSTVLRREHDKQKSVSRELPELEPQA